MSESDPKISTGKKHKWEQTIFLPNCKLIIDLLFVKKNIKNYYYYYFFLALFIYYFLERI